MGDEPQPTSGPMLLASWRADRTIGRRPKREPRGYSPAVLTRARRPDVADGLVGVAVLTAFLTLVWLGRGLTFFADEWAIMADRTISIDSFIQPFNEHWLGVTIVIYRLMLQTFGLGTYMPYLALLAAFHVVVVLEVYVVARRSTAAPLAALAAVVIAFFGSGFENLFWSMQIGFLIAIALGLGALIVLRGSPSTSRVVVATGLLTVGMMTSGFGIFMLVLVGLDLLLDPTRRRMALALFVPGLVYVAWYLVFGRSGLATTRDPFTIDAVLSVPKFVLEGVGTAFGSVIGVGPTLGIPGAIGLAVGLIVQNVRVGHIPRRALAAFGAIVFMYALLGLIRAQLFDGAAEYSRYAYLSGIFAILGLVALVGRRTMPAEPRRRTLALAAMAGVFALALIWNGWLLLAGRGIFEDRAAYTRAAVAVVLSELPLGVDPNKVKLLDRTVTRLREVIAEFGSPLADSLAGDAVPSVDPALVERIRQDLLAQQAGH